MSIFQTGPSTASNLDAVLTLRGWSASTYTCLGAGVLIASIWTTPAHADAVEIEQVVVSAARFEQSTVSVPASIEIITREEIEASGAVHIVDVLRGRGGVQVSDQFGDGSRTSVGIRGFGETAHANTLVLVDGRRLNNNDIAGPDLNSIALHDVERVEIIQGSAGTLFGDQAVGGVINIITRKVRKRHAELLVSSGSYGRQGTQAVASQRFASGLSYRVAGEIRESSNYRDHNSVHLRNVFAKAGFDYSLGSVFVEFHQIDENLHAPGSLTTAQLAANRRQASPTAGNDFVNTDTTVLRAGVQHTFGDHWSLEAEVSNREVQANFILTVGGFTPALSTQSRHVMTFAPRLIGAYPTARGDLQITLGYDWELSDYRLVSPFGVQRNDQRIQGFYGQAVVPLSQRWSLTVGARNARVENDHQDDFTFPRGIDIEDEELVTEAGISFTPTPEWRLFARRDENFRFAKVDEVADPVPGVALKSQTGTSYEFGAEWTTARARARAVAYRLDLENEITVVPGVGAFGFAANTNLAPTRRDGLILAGSLQATDRLRVGGDYTFIDGTVTEGPLRGKRVPFISEHLLRLTAQYSFPSGVRLYGEMQAIDKRVFSGDFDQVLDTLPGYAVFNLKADYRRGPWLFSARMNNVLDREYVDFGARATIFPAPTFAAVQIPSFLPAPERNLWVTVRYVLE